MIAVMDALRPVGVRGTRHARDQRTRLAGDAERARRDRERVGADRIGIPRRRCATDGEFSSLVKGRSRTSRRIPPRAPWWSNTSLWYDRHFDPAWQDVVLTPASANDERTPVGYMVPRSADDLARMGRCFAATCFLSAGNITHTPAYGHMIALGVLHAVGVRNASPQQVPNAEAYRAHIARTGRFLDFRRRRGDDRLSPAREPCRARRPSHRARDRCRRGGERQDRHAHQPRLCRGRLYRRHQRRRLPGRACDVLGCGELARRHGDLPPPGGPRRQPVRRTVEQPLRRARRPDVARRRVHPVGARVPHRALRRAGRPLAVLAPALLLAGESRVHPRPWPGLRARDGAGQA